jgi:hypothetical protein
MVGFFRECCSCVNSLNTLRKKLKFDSGILPAGGDSDFSMIVSFSVLFCTFCNIDWIRGGDIYELIQRR